MAMGRPPWDDSDDDDEPSGADTPEQFLEKMERKVRRHIAQNSPCNCYPEVELSLVLLRESPMHMAACHNLPDSQLMAMFGTNDLEEVGQRPLACRVNPVHEDNCTVHYIEKAEMN